MRQFTLLIALALTLLVASPALAMGKNAVVFGGGFYPEDGSSQGFVRIVDRETGKVTGTHRFPAPLSFQGLAIEGGKIYATFENGKLVCLGGE